MFQPKREFPCYLIWGGEAIEIFSSMYHPTKILPTSFIFILLFKILLLQLSYSILSISAVQQSDVVIQLYRPSFSFTCLFKRLQKPLLSVFQKNKKTKKKKEKCTNWMSFLLSNISVSGKVTGEECNIPF